MDSFMSHDELIEKYGHDIAIILDRAKHELEYISLNGLHSVPVNSTIKPSQSFYDTKPLPRKKALQNLVRFSFKDTSNFDPNILYQLKTKVIKNFLQLHYPILGDEYFVN